MIMLFKVFNKLIINDSLHQALLKRDSVAIGRQLLGSDKKKTGVTFETLYTSGTMPVEIDLLKINANGLKKVLKAN